MPASIFNNGNEAWEGILLKQDDVEIEDDDMFDNEDESETEEEENNEENEPAESPGSPEDDADVFRPDEENLAVSECF